MEVPRRIAAACALLLAAAGLAFAEGFFFAAALPLALWASLGLFRKAPRPELGIERSLSSSFIEAGGCVEVTLRACNLGPRLACLLLEDEVPMRARIVGGKATWKGSLGEGATAEIRYRLEPERGVHHFDRVAARSEEPFAATTVGAEFSAAAILVVTPRSHFAPDLALTARSVRSFAGHSRIRRTGSGSDFAGTREYSPGDPLRSLNWRAEALWDQGVVNLFEEERALDVGIILDARAEAYEGTELFEAAVSAAASLAEVLLLGGNRAAFLSYGSTVEWTAPGLGREQRLKIRLAAARASLGDHAAFERFDNLPISLFPPRSSILLVSPLIREDLRPLRSLVALGYSVTVLRPHFKPREEGIAEGREPDRPLRLARRMLALEYSILRSRLSGARIEVIDWAASGPLAAVVPGTRRGR